MAFPLAFGVWLDRCNGEDLPRKSRILVLLDLKGLLCNLQRRIGYARERDSVFERVVVSEGIHTFLLLYGADSPNPAG
jgi:hypothetical protein